MQVMYPTSSRPSRSNGTFRGSTGDIKLSILSARMLIPVNQITSDGAHRMQNSELLVLRARISFRICSGPDDPERRTAGKRVHRAMAKRRNVFAAAGTPVYARATVPKGSAARSVSGVARKRSAQRAADEG